MKYFNKLGRNVHTKSEANPCSGLREEVEKVEKFTTTDTE